MDAPVLVENEKEEKEVKDLGAVKQRPVSPLHRRDLLLCETDWYKQSD
jgi:hypothetical protein